MTHKKVKDFIRVLFKVFKVENWRKEVIFTRESGNADMTVNHRYKQFRLQIHKDFYSADPEYQADTLIHEFCHLFNLPVANLVGEMKEGNLITSNHLDDVLENANIHAENVVVNLLKDDSLKKAYRAYTKPSRSSQSRLTKRKRGSKLRSKRIKKKTGTR